MKQCLSIAVFAVLAMPACAQPQAPQDVATAAQASSGRGSDDATPVAQPAPPPAPDPVSAKDMATYEACMGRLRGDAVEAGVSAAAFDAQVDGLVPDLSVIDLLDAQPEFKTAIWDYLAGLVDDERIADGRAMLERHADVLARVEDRYGVDPATVVAVWGVESDYGNTFGKRPLLQSLSTLSCFGRRQEFFRGELFSAMRILEKGDIEPGALQGSWAGAFGHTQFMPSTFERIAVDFDGDGRRDLVGSVPDAHASTAHYLDRSGWRTGEPWGVEVELPAGFDESLAGRTKRRSLSEWFKHGIQTVDDRPIDLPGQARAAVLLPAGVDGPAFLVFRNFDAIYSYNAATSYALAIAHLSDRLRGAGPFEAAWPTDDPGLSRAQRRELQELLLARGHDIGEVDGMLGSRTRAAIRREQERLGHAPADGRGGMKILEALRAEAR